MYHPEADDNGDFGHTPNCIGIFNDGQYVMTLLVENGDPVLYSDIRGAQCHIASYDLYDPEFLDKLLRDVRAPVPESRLLPTPDVPLLPLLVATILVL